VRVQAGMLIEQALTPEARALILAAGAAGHYEIAVGPKQPQLRPEVIVSVCVEAYRRGLSLTGQQFAVFPKRGGEASLYVKSNGYRHLFATSGRAGAVSVSIGYPEVKPLETAGKTKQEHDTSGGKAIALIAGKVSVVWDSQPVSVEASGEYRIGLPCYITDNIDGLQAKAERRLLKRLWETCSGLHEADPETDDLADVECDLAIQPQAVIEDPAEAVHVADGERDWDSEKERFVAEYQQIKDDPLKTLYLSVMRASDENAVKAAMEAAATAKLSAKERNSLQLARDWQLERIAAGVV